MVSALWDTPDRLHLLFPKGKGKPMSMASLWNPPKATEGPDGNAHRDTFNHFPAALADRDLKIPADDQTANVMPV